MNFYPLHIGDYAAHTRNLSLLEDLAYRRLLDAYYLAEHPFNGSSTDVAREIGMRDQVAEVEYVLCKFFEREGDSWRNKRADTEIAKYRGKLEKASRAGKASAERRSNIRSTSVADSSNIRSTSVAQKTNRRATNHEPRTNNQINTPLPPKGDVVDLPPGFVEFWGAWPKGSRTGSKSKCVEVWQRAKLEPVTATIVAHVTAMKASEGWRKQGGQFIPMPLTYLNQRRWEGSLVDEAGGNKGGQPAWVVDAGFATEAEANNARCWQHNAGEFRDGQRIAEAA